MWVGCVIAHTAVKVNFIDPQQNTGYAEVGIYWFRFIWSTTSLCTLERVIEACIPRRGTFARSARLSSTPLVCRGEDKLI